MKKLLSIIFVIALLITPFASVQANEEIGFLEALSNTYELESYKILQSLYGDLKIDDYGDIVDMDYRLSFSGNTNSEQIYESNQYLRVNGFMQINVIKTENSLPDEERYYPRSFDQLTINFNGEIISIFDDGVYFRLGELNVSSKGIKDEELNEINDFLKIISDYRNGWYKIPMTEFTANTQEELMFEFGEGFNTELFDPETVMEYFQKNDIKTALGNYMKDIFSLLKDEGEMTDEEYNQAVEIINLIINTEFFNIRDVISGRNIGFKFFSFNKGSVINLVQDLAKVLGETIDYSQLKAIREMLGKFSFAGIYRINDEHDIIDNLLIKFSLRNVGELIDANFNYRYKINNFNNAPKVSAPTDYDEIEDLAGLLPY